MLELVESFAGTHPYMHVYYRHRGSEHWWCRCFRQGEQHACVTLQEWSSIAPMTRDGARAVHWSTRAQAQAFIEQYARLLVEEIRTHQSKEPCPHFDTWCHPPRGAVLHWRHER